MPHTSLVHYETDNPEIVQGFRVSSILAECQTSFQRVRIYNTPAFGKVLVLDDETQSAERDEKVYHESLVHPAMSTFGGENTPRRVLIIGGGECATAREVLRYPSIENVTMVDIDGELMELCREHLPEWGMGAWSDKRLNILAEDAYTWLNEYRGDKFDVIIMDLCDPDFTDKGNQINRFYTREFTGLVYRTLNEHGVFVMQCGDYETMGISASPVFDTFRREQCHTYTVFIPSFTSMWGFLIARKGSVAHLETLAARLPTGLKHMTHKRLLSLMSYDFMEAPGYDILK